MYNVALVDESKCIAEKGCRLCIMYCPEADTIMMNENKKAYVSFYEIEPSMKINPSYALKNEEFNAFQSLSFSPSISGDLGTYIILIISSDQPINLENLNILAQKTNSRGIKNDPQVDWKRYVYEIVEK